MDQGILSNARRSDEDEWLTSERSWVKWMEIFFGVDVNIVLVISELQKFILTGLCKRTLLRKSLRTSLISGWLITYSSWDSISSSFLTDKY